LGSRQLCQLMYLSLSPSWTAITLGSWVLQQFGKLVAPCGGLPVEPIFNIKIEGRGGDWTKVVTTNGELKASASKKKRSPPHPPPLISCENRSKWTSSPFFCCRHKQETGNSPKSRPHWTQLRRKQAERNALLSRHIFSVALAPGQGMRLLRRQLVLLVDFDGLVRLARDQPRP